MRAVAKIVLTGVAVLGIAGAVTAAERDVHVLKVALPDGSIEEIHYTGDVAPKGIMAPDADSPFASMDRMFAEFDAQADAMLAHAAALASVAPALTAAGDRATLASSNDRPAGDIVRYSYVSTSGSAGGDCVQSYRMTTYDGQQAPKVVSQRRGDCQGVSPLVPTAMAADAAAAKPTPVPATAKAEQQAGHPVVVTSDAHVI